MKTLELSSRKNTTENARKSVIEFINSFDFSNLSDIREIESKTFNLSFSKDGSGYIHDKAYFTLRNCGFCIVSYSTEDEEYCIYHREIEKVWSNIKHVFDETCTFINFKQLVASMEDFIKKINDAIEIKESEITDFLLYVEGWKSYQDTAKNADEVEGMSETV